MKGGTGVRLYGIVYAKFLPSLFIPHLYILFGTGNGGKGATAAGGGAKPVKAAGGGAKSAKAEKGAGGGAKPAKAAKNGKDGAATAEGGGILDSI